MIKCVIFDFEDTLIRFASDWFAAASKVREIYLKAGVPEDKFVLQHRYDATGIIDDFNKIISQMYTKDKVKEIESEADKVIESCEVQGVEEAELMPNAIEILRYIREKGLKVGIATNNSELPVNMVIDKFGMRKYVDAVITRSSEGKMKPHPDYVIACLKALDCKPEEAILVGDGEVDMVAAKRARVLAVGIMSRWGNKTMDAWVEAWRNKTRRSADIVIDDLLEIRSLLSL